MIHGREAGVEIGHEEMTGETIEIGIVIDTVGMTSVSSLVDSLNHCQTKCLIRLCQSVASTLLNRILSSKYSLNWWEAFLKL